jgi:hypothetical protein
VNSLETLAYGAGGARAGAGAGAGGAEAGAGAGAGRWLLTELPLWWRLQISANSPFSGSKSQNPPIMTIIGIFRAFLIPIWLVMTTIGILKQFCFEEISYKFQFGPL